MSVSKYRLSPMGWMGAVLFVLPTPIAAWKISQLMDPAAAAFQRRLDDLSGAVSLPHLSPLLVAVLATASLVGLVMLLVGREIVTDG
jgi:hypothetical protein